MKQQGLCTSLPTPIEGSAIKCCGISGLAYARALRLRQVGLLSGTFVGRERVGERTFILLPDATLDPVKITERDLDDPSQPPCEVGIPQISRGMRDTRDEELIARRDSVAAVGDSSRRPAQLFGGRLLVQRYEEHSHDDGGQEEGAPAYDEPTDDRTWYGSAQKA